MQNVHLSGDVDLEGRGLGDEGCLQLVRLVKQSVANNGGVCDINRINLKRNGIGDEGARYLMELMEFPIVFHLSYNKLTNKGSDLLLDAVLERSRLGLPHGDFYEGYNTGIQRPFFFESWFSSQKIKLT